MQHGTDKTGPARDDVMKKELRAEMTRDRSLRTVEERELQPAGEDQPEAVQAPGASFRGGTPHGMSPEDVAVRSELAQHLGRSMYPVDRLTVVERLVRDNAPDRLIALAKRLPEGERYGNVQSIAQSLGLGTEDLRD
ncbi:DUF2795 domain-containing protein [Streptomyces gilvosporeus]|uniref:DUF2795 domain-containing protein n=1 Tax=Streptomyces gilvosporeus TaxID=553510 RepID=A0A1V0U1A7_9ACTN|nr:DUF2795 domain-containing protein [Streptomyces gilvosporeus]ARF58830.1 hypothetical protein B1H19_35765 [Streptomyces gilvosporeus]